MAWRRNVVAFLAVSDEVQAGLDAGHATTTLFAYLRDGGRVSFCYDTLLKYVHRYIRTPKKALPPAILKTPAPPRPVGNVGEPVKSKKEPNGIPGFFWNSIPDKDKLI